MDSQTNGLIVGWTNKLDRWLTEETDGQIDRFRVGGWVVR